TFMIPLERYMSSLMPLAKNISPTVPLRSKVLPPRRLFPLPGKVRPQLTSSIKGDWEALYRRFFKSQTFLAETGDPTPGVPLRVQLNTGSMEKKSSTRRHGFKNTEKTIRQLT
ncbi:Protein FAM116Alike, partial [Caligus rogercresseyi]